MLALLDAILTNGFDLKAQAATALDWLQTGAYQAGGVRFDVGGTTARALRRLADGTPPGRAGGTGVEENGNGSLMRILPVALVGRDLSLPHLVEAAMAASSVTHRHPRARVTCAVYVALARELLDGEAHLPDLPHQVASDVGACLYGAELDALRELMAYPVRAGTGYVLDCFWSAWDVLLAAADYRDAVTSAVRMGSDTDTTACVTGGLAGIHFGLAGIPTAWREAMRGREIAQPLVDRLLRTATPF